MQDEAETTQGRAADERPLTPPSRPRRQGSARAMLIVALLGFVIGGALVAWLVWHGDLDPVLPHGERQAIAAPAETGTANPQKLADNLPPIANGSDAMNAEAGLGNLETRLALLEDRFSRIGLQANAAGANASRAEALLIALAARRRIDRGEPLGYVEDQLKLRFGGAQPRAVRTIIAASRNPVTLYLLSSQLDAAAPALAGARTQESSWTRVKREIASLFVVRRSSSTAATPRDRVERAQILLKAGRTEDAIAEVERLPGAEDAQDWIAAARRYEEAQRALDLVETAAMLEPRQLRDDSGEQVDQPSPLSPPAEEAAPAG
jgi:hypothetical protein